MYKEDLALNNLQKVDMPLLYAYLQHHNDTINKQMQEDFFNKIYTSHFIARVRKGLLKGLRVRGSWRPNRN